MTFTIWDASDADIADRPVGQVGSARETIAVASDRGASRHVTQIGPPLRDSYGALCSSDGRQRFLLDFGEGWSALAHSVLAGEGSSDLSA